MALPDTVIRDFIHGDISLSELERKIIDTPDFQRLRGIYQTSLNYLVYPSMRHSRFEHSLGVMHLAGAMWEAIVENSTSSDKLKESLANLLRVIRRDILNLGKYKRKVDDSRLISLIHTCLRLAGLLHDIGHLPFSHLFEHAAKGPYSEELKPDSDGWQVEEKAKLHENNGVWLIFSEESPIRKIIDEADAEFVNQLGLSMDATPHISLLKELFKEDKTSDIFALRQIYSSNFDVDRFDYIQRDGLLSGSKGNAVDVERILNSFVLVDRDVQFSKNMVTETSYPARFFIVPGIKSLSALETLIAERIRQFRWVNYHQAVECFSSVLESLIFTIFVQLDHESRLNNRSGEKTSFMPVSNHFNSEHFRAERLVDLDGGRLCDDADFIIRLRNLYRELKDANEALLNLHHKRMLDQIEQIIFRKKHYRPLWKRITGYGNWNVDYGDRIRKAFVDTLKTILASSDTLGKLLSPEAKELFDKDIGNFLAAFLIAGSKRVDPHQQLEEVMLELYGIDIVVKTLKFKAFENTPEEVNIIYDYKDDAGNLRALEDVSGHFKETGSPWDHSIHLFVYYREPEGREDVALIKEKLADAVCHWIEYGGVNTSALHEFSWPHFIYSTCKAVREV